MKLAWLALLSTPAIPARSAPLIETRNLPLLPLVACRQLTRRATFQPKASPGSGTGPRNFQSKPQTF
jgi:hypothetical protein